MKINANKENVYNFLFNSFSDWEISYLTSELRNGFNYLKMECGQNEAK